MRPSFPATLATSGVSLITLSCQAIRRFTSVREVLGTSTGMKSRLPSSRVGMNSLPIPAATRSNGASPCARAQVPTAAGKPRTSMAASPRRQTAPAMTVLRQRNAQSSTGS